jgi:signal-transduction protein with cAMP-binding, CBS, and nucleotidyltransferase domain
MTLQEYIKKNVNAEESLPFEIELCSYKKDSKILSVGQVEKNIYFLVSGILEVGRITDGKETIFDFKHRNRFISAFSSYHTQEKSDTYISCITDCVVEKIPLSELRTAQKTSLIANQLGRHMLLLAYLSVVQKEKDASTKSPQERYMELVKNRPEIIQEVPSFKIAEFLGVHPTSLSRIKKAYLLADAKKLVL